MPMLPHLRAGQPMDAHVIRAASAEFLGVLLFQLVAGTATDLLAIACSFSAIQYATKYISGGHLNPAVSLAASMSGHIRWSIGFIYIIVQVLGAVTGALMQAWLVPDAHIGQPSAGCISPSEGVNGWELFGWEATMALLFIMVQYSALFVPPAHGDAAPLASLVTLFAILQSAGKFTGNSPVNPARSIASSLVFNCFWKVSWLYLGAHVVAALLGSTWAMAWHGRGPMYSPAVAEGGTAASYEEGLLRGTGEGGLTLGAGREATFAPIGAPRMQPTTSSE